MKKNTQRHQRSVSIDINPINVQIFDGVAFDFNQQKLFGVKNDKLYPLVGKSKLQFKRKKLNLSEKILHESVSANGEAFFNSNDPLLTYNHIIAVDTNTRDIQGTKVSVTAAFHLVPTGRNGELISASSTILAVIEAWDVVEKPENHGWWQVLKSVTEQSHLFPGSIVLVVDSDLGEHSAFNSREKPIFLDYYLPDNVTIIYGSDAGGPEHLTTQLVRYCHSTADTVFKNENLVMDLQGLVPGISGLYTYFRQWKDPGIFKKFTDR